jgi:calcineurin-like phosphoesterase
MVKQLPSRFEVAEGPAMVNGVAFEIDTLTGKATSIQRIQFKENEASAKDSASSHSSELSQIV